MASSFHGTSDLLAKTRLCFSRQTYIELNGSRILTFVKVYNQPEAEAMMAGFWKLHATSAKTQSTTKQEFRVTARPYALLIAQKRPGRRVGCVRASRVHRCPTIHDGACRRPWKTVRAAPPMFKGDNRALNGISEANHCISCLSRL